MSRSMFFPETRSSIGNNKNPTLYENHFQKKKKYLTLVSTEDKRNMSQAIISIYKKKSSKSKLTYLATTSL